MNDDCCALLVPTLPFAQRRVSDMGTKAEDQASPPDNGSAKRSRDEGFCGAAFFNGTKHPCRRLREAQLRDAQLRDMQTRETPSDGASSDGESASGCDSYSDSEAGMCRGTCQDCGKQGKVIVTPGETMDAAWWDRRFQNDIEDGTNSEWVASFDSVARFMLPHLDAAGRTLVVGCGNSDFSELLCEEAGFTDIVNTDISKVVIDHMREAHAANKAMTWVVDDAVSMSFGDCAFDQIVDKSLLDCLCHVEDPEYAGCVNDFVRECHRVLRPGGAAIFATKQIQDELEKHMPCAGPLESRWCELDWAITRQTVFAPKDDTKAVAVEDPALLPVDCEEFDTIFIFTAVKGGTGGARRNCRSGERVSA